MHMQLVSQHDSIGQWIETELADVENRFAAELLSDLPCVNRLVDHIEQYRGKMLRPRLVLTSALASAPGANTVNDGHRLLATVVEMVHMATLVHDDILDEARLRRRGLTVNQLEGNETAVMLGDYLISHAYHLCSSMGRDSISRAISETTNTVCEGELLQLANRGNWMLDEPTYFEIIRRKTASLCGACCRLSSVLSGVNGETTDCLTEFGEKVGIAFQIVDDLLDLMGREDTVGKTLGRDLDKGKLTLPLIRHLATADPQARRLLLEVLEGPDGPEPSQLDELRDAVARGDAVDYARDWARRLVDQAKGALVHLSDTPARVLLARMAEAVLTRRF